jgi:hypothetical protein
MNHKKIIGILFVLVLCSSEIYSQDSLKASTKSTKRKFWIGLNFSPDLCYRNLVVLGDTSNTRYSYKKYETYKFNFSAGVSVLYYLKDNINIESGLQYSNKGYRSIWRYSDNYISGKFEHIYSWYYADIPLRVNICFGNKKLKYTCGAGIIGNILLASGIRYNSFYDGGTTSTHYDNGWGSGGLDKSTASFTVNAGVVWQFKDNQQIKFEPTFRYVMFDTSKRQLFKTYLWTMGLNIGYYFNCR